jgi:SAM-dependent methyltransferase
MHYKSAERSLTNLMGKLETIVLRLFYARLSRRLFTNLWYATVSGLDKNCEVTFLNYGFAYLNDYRIPLNREDEFDRYPIQLYHRITSGVSLKGKDVLEVGCGRGGGASYIARYLHPSKVTAVDICKAAVRFATLHYACQHNLDFRIAHAQNLPFPNDSFDVVISVESAHHYADIIRFLDEAYRVLRPGGSFLVACYEDPQKKVFPKEALHLSNFRVVTEFDIAANVVLALTIDAPRRQMLARKLCPRLLGRLPREFAGLPGTELYNSFASGKCPYFYFRCLKEP